MKAVCIGVLALQGGFSKHIEMLQALSCQTIEVRRPKDLNQCQGLIIPGGESTSLWKQIEFIKLYEPLIEFAKKHPVFGTCAGLILISKTIKGENKVPFGLIDVESERNAFGRQADSFTSQLLFQPEGKKSQWIEGVFIRAPRIRKWGVEVKVLATFEKEPVLIQQNFHLGATFHPELMNESTIHAYFLTLVSQSNRH